MSGTVTGGKRAIETRISGYVRMGFTSDEAMAKVREDFARIGRTGGQNGHTGGFAANPEFARIAGAKGGRISRRGKTKRGEYDI